jgi:hypothetical protein
MEPGQLRVASPSMLIAALVLFCLPWVNVSCRTPDGDMLRVSQTGLQSALGKSTVSIHGNDGTVRVGDSLLDGPNALAGDNDFGAPRTGGDVDAAPLMLLYAVVLIGGAVAGFVVPTDRPRMAAVGGCGAAAAALLMLQLVAGFPLTSNIPVEMANSTQLQTSYSLWLWLSLLVTLAVPAAVCLEHNLRRQTAAAVWPADEL